MINELYTLSSATRTDFVARTPAHLELMRFQHVGVQYLTHVKRALLADEMGLGKTITAIAYMNTIGVDRYMVLCPASLQDNWRREIKKWSMSQCEPHIYRTGRATPKHCILILSYGLCIHFELLDRILKNYRFGALIADEVHMLKSPLARRAQLLYAKNGVFDRVDAIAALSGTPILNKPIEIFPIVNKLNPQVFEEKEFDAFGAKYCEARRNVFSGKIEYRGSKNAAQLNFLLRSRVMCRRLKTEVLPQLPAKIKRVIYLENASCGLAYIVREHELYSAFCEDGLSSEGNQNMLHVRNILGLLKVEQIVSYAKTILEEQEKIIIFGWHKEVLARIGAALADFNPLVLTGATPPNVRSLRVDAFHSDPDRRVFIGSIAAAGVGLNLQIAHYILFAELSWVPGENAQAEDRAHRIGQAKSVVIDYLIFENSVDERILNVTNEKAKIIKNVLDVNAGSVNNPF